MHVSFPSFVLLFWFPAALRAQTAARPCRAPRLDGGFFVPVREIYSHGSQISYACDGGHKPVAEGWWTTSTCQNGAWSHVPQCIDDNACIPPTIPNAKYTDSSNSWYENQATIRTTCDKGYKHKRHLATASCINGTWSTLPVCEKSLDTCTAPPRVPHAVIIHLGYQELFAVDSEVQYQCEDGYTIDGTQTKKSIFCLRGIWTQAPECRSSSSSGTNDRDVYVTSIYSCGKYPLVQNGDVVELGETFLKYQCNRFYTRVGPENVLCYSTGTWSEAPTCKANFCTLDTEQYPALEPAGVKFIHNGDKASLACVPLDHWWTKHYSVVRCTKGRLTMSECCNWAEINMKIC